jgi:hypothetical protein
MSEEEKKAVERMKQVLAKNVHTFINELEIVLNLVEKLQKENEEWREAYQEEKDKQFELIQNTNNTIKTANIAIKDLQEKLKEVIPVQKVKDKIEEIDKIYNDIPEDEGNFAKAILIKEKQVLQELLEGRK